MKAKAAINHQFLCQLYFSLEDQQLNMQEQQLSHHEDAPITPAKILEDLLEVSQLEFNQSPSARQLQFEQPHHKNQEQHLADLLQQRKVDIEKKREDLRSIQMQILSVNKFHEEFIELHDERRIVQKDILDLEFEVIRIERELEIRKRNKNAVNIVEEQDELQEGQLQRKTANETIKEAPQEEEQSLKISQIRRMENSLASREETAALQSYMISSIKKKNHSEQQSHRKPREPSQISPKKNSINSHSKNWQKDSSRLFQPGISLSTFTRRQGHGYPSADEFYRQEMELSILQNRLAMHYIHMRYLS